MQEVARVLVEYPHSNLRVGIATILRDRGFVEKVSETKAESGIKHIEIHLKYKRRMRFVDFLGLVNPAEDLTVDTVIY